MSTAAAAATVQGERDLVKITCLPTAGSNARLQAAQSSKFSQSLKAATPTPPLYHDRDDTQLHRQRISSHSSPFFCINIKSPSRRILRLSSVKAVIPGPAEPRYLFRSRCGRRTPPPPSRPVQPRATEPLTRRSTGGGSRNLQQLACQVHDKAPTIQWPSAPHMYWNN